jgi:hypothetical protein
MALISIQRFRDVLVRTGVADEAPALDLSVGLEQELDETLAGFVSHEQADSSYALLRADMGVLRAEIRQLFAEQEARHQQQLNRLAAIMLTGAALIAAVASILVVVLG